MGAPMRGEGQGAVLRQLSRPGAAALGDMAADLVVTEERRGEARVSGPDRAAGQAGGAQRGHVPLIAEAGAAAKPLPASLPARAGL